MKEWKVNIISFKNPYDKIAIHFSYEIQSHWLREGVSLLHQSQSEILG